MYSVYRRNRTLPQILRSRSLFFAANCQVIEITHHISYWQQYWQIYDNTFRKKNLRYLHNVLNL